MISVILAILLVPYVDTILNTWIIPLRLMNKGDLLQMSLLALQEPIPCQDFMGILETFSSHKLHFFLIPLMMISGHVEENPAHGIVIPAGGFARDFFCLPEEMHRWRKLRFPSTQPEHTKGHEAFPDHVDLVHSSSKWTSCKGPSQPFLVLMVCKRKWGRNTEQDFDSLIP